MQNNPGMTRCGFNSRHVVGFNYRVADLEMQAGAVRKCISMVLAAPHSYEPLLEITMLFCQGMSKASIIPTRVRDLADRPVKTCCLCFDSPKHFQ